MRIILAPINTVKYNEVFWYTVYKFIEEVVVGCCDAKYFPIERVQSLFVVNGDAIKEAIFIYLGSTEYLMYCLKYLVTALDQKNISYCRLNLTLSPNE